MRKLLFYCYRYYIILMFLFFLIVLPFKGTQPPAYVTPFQSGLTEPPHPIIHNITSKTNFGMKQFVLWRLSKVKKRLLKRSALLKEISKLAKPSSIQVWSKRASIELYKYGVSCENTTFTICCVNPLTSNGSPATRLSQL